MSLGGRLGGAQRNQVGRYRKAWTRWEKVHSEDGGRGRGCWAESRALPQSYSAPEAVHSIVFFLSQQEAAWG